MKIIVEIKDVKFNNIEAVRNLKRDIIRQVQENVEALKAKEKGVGL